MPIESAADRAVFTNPSEFGTEILWHGHPKPIPAIWQSGTIMLGAMDGPDMQSREATLVVRAEDLPEGHAEEDKVNVGTAAYFVRSIEPDGTGFALVRLELNDE